MEDGNQIPLSDKDFPPFNPRRLEEFTDSDPINLSGELSVDNVNRVPSDLTQTVSDPNETFMTDVVEIVIVFKPRVKVE
jgi:hypothetical protein